MSPVVLAAGLGELGGVLVGVVVALVLLCVFLAAAEVAVSRTSEARAASLDDEHGSTSSRRLVALAGSRDWVNPVRLLLLSAVIVQAVLVGVLAERAYGGWGMAGLTALDVLVVFVIADVAPRTWAIQHVDRSALLAARPIYALYRFAPLRVASRLLIRFTNVLLPGKGLARGPYVSEEELLAIADAAMADEVIDEGERKLISSIIEFGDTIVREVMVPRPDMVSVPGEFRVSDVMEVVILNGYSRLPVTGAGIDDIVGVAYAKDLMRAERDGMGAEPVRGLVRPARFVPETKRVSPLLRELQIERVHLAVVIDEHGGTAGVVTLEDLLEELVGEITDEYDTQAPELRWGVDGRALVAGSVDVDEVNVRLGLAIPESDGFDSVGGYVLARLGHVPGIGEEVRCGRHALVVDRVLQNRISRIRIEQREGWTDGGDDVVVAAGVERRAADG